MKSKGIIMNYKEKLFKTLYEQQIPFYFPMGSEVSLAKKINIKYLKTVKEVISKFKLPIRIRYRGSSTTNYRRNPSYMHMDYASSFTLYNKY